MYGVTLKEYLGIALWLTGRVDSTLAELTEGGNPASYYPQDMQLPEEEQKLLWNAFYASKQEVSK